MREIITALHNLQILRNLVMFCLVFSIITMPYLIINHGLVGFLLFGVFYLLFTVLTFSIRVIISLLETNAER